MKKIITLVLFFICIFYVSVNATQGSFDATDMAQALPQEAVGRIEAVLPDFSFSDIVDNLMSGSFTPDFSGIIKTVLSFLFKEVKLNIAVCTAVLILAVCSSLFCNMQTNLSGGGTSDVAFLSCFLLTAGLLTSGFMETAELTSAVIDELIVSVQSLVPVLTSMSIASGNIISAPVLNTVILMAASLCSIIIRDFLIPLTYAVFAMKLIDSITQTKSLFHLTQFLDKVMRWVLGMMLVLFTSGIAISGFAAGSVQGVGAKAAKYAMSSLIPVAGGALADTITSLSSSAMMIKNATGIGGIIFIVCMLFYPLIKIAALALLYNALSAVVGTITDSRFSSAISGFSQTATMLFSQTAVVGVMFIISIAILLSASGIGG